MSDLTTNGEYQVSFLNLEIHPTLIWLLNVSFRRDEFERLVSEAKRLDMKMELQLVLVDEPYEEIPHMIHESK